jgi:hypothetical protein
MIIVEKIAQFSHYENSLQSPTSFNCFHKEMTILQGKKKDMKVINGP